MEERYEVKQGFISQRTRFIFIQIECKRALKREEILAGNEGDSNDCKSFRPSLFYFSI
jgi:hypothetical protein